MAFRRKPCTARTARFIALLALVLVACALVACARSAPVQSVPCSASVPSPSPTLGPIASTPVAIDPSGDWDIRWDRTLVGWKPPVFNGKLSIHKEADQWTASLRFRESSAKPTFKSLRIDGDRIDLIFAASAHEDGSGETEIELAAWIRGDHILGEMRWGSTIAWSPCSGRRAVARDTTPADLWNGAVAHSMPKGDFAQSGIHASALQALVDHAKEERSSALVVVKDGKIVVEMYREGYDGSPLMAMSASKSIVSIAMGMLIADKKITLDTQLGAILPEWKPGPKGAITVRQLLTHTSGIDPSRANWNGETIRQHALDAKLVFAPGTSFQYNNGAVDFLGVVFKQAAGVSLDAYLDTKLFQKLDMVGASWLKDPEGTPRGAGELRIRPIDLAKIGELMLEGGNWNGMRTVPADWVKGSVEAGQPFVESCGFLWWREGAKNGLSTGFSARGWLGQFLVVLPKERLVAVRMRASESSDYDHDRGEENGYQAFADDVAKLY